MVSSNNNKRLDFAKIVLEKITHKYFILIYRLLKKGWLSHLEIADISEITQQSVRNHLVSPIENHIVCEIVDENYQNILLEEFGNIVTFSPKNNKIKVYSPTSDQHVNGVVLTQNLFENKNEILELYEELCDVLNKIGEYLV